ncbi:MAG: acetolactate decarboxylase [Nitrospirae bacterium]|nr:acetolactate decarboxylase [Nitrospirota bacterium]MBF0540266.1 acetolactate decarboxylase [Nitrospirota bacterium]
MIYNTLNQRKIQIRILFLLLIISLTACGHANIREDTIFQSSTIQNLSAGGFEGTTTFDQLRKLGDFGLGTFNELDGEMIALDGEFLQIRSDGSVHKAVDSWTTPFAVVKRFKADSTYEIVGNPLDYEGLMDYIDEKLPNKNLPYAIKITGTFSYIKSRSVPKQKQPYPRLEEAIKHQAIFEFRDISGTMVGFRFPEYLNGINVAGYHFHFITNDKLGGGHIIDVKIKDIKIEVDNSCCLFLILPVE